MMNLKKLGSHLWMIILGFLFMGSSFTWSENIVTNQTTTTQYIDDLQTAINEASTGDVLLLEGTFNGPFVINGPDLGIRALTLTGTSSSERAILDGQKTNRVLVVLGPQTEVPEFSVVLENLIIQNGSVTSENADELKLGPNGGGILNAFTDLRLSSVIIKNNHAENIGGGIANILGTLTVKFSNFIGNDAYQGGAISSYASTTTILDSTIDGNSADDAGGAMLFNTSINKVSNCTIENNQATFGGGIFNNYSSTTIETTRIRNNIAKEDGGGLYNYNKGAVDINSSKIKANQANLAKESGGGIFNDSATYILINSTVRKNIPDDIVSTEF